MGYPSYRGPITTLHQALMAHAVVIVLCQACGHDRPMFAWRIYQMAGARAFTMPLNKPIGGFWCRHCRRGVKVTLKIPGHLRAVIEQ